jgi:threonine dehydrogenase-like Zn-dependent dehydrogenase
VLAATGGRGVDTAVVAVGGGAGPDATALIWPGLADAAALHLFGGFSAQARLRLRDGACLAPGPLRAAAGTEAVTTPVGRKALLMGSRGGRHSDFLAALRLAGSPEGGLALHKLVSHVISLSALPAVAAELADEATVDGEPALRVVVDLRLDGIVVGPFVGSPATVGPRPR